MTEQLYQEMLQRGLEIMKEQDEGAMHAVTIDHNHDISSMAASAGHSYMMLPPEQATIVGKTLTEIAFYLGYLAGKEEGNLKLWEDQL